MKVPIKFRAETLDGYPVYGGIFIAGRDVYIAENFRFIPVKPKTLAQLVGYDADGNEVYEGDIVTLDYENWHMEYSARLRSEAVSDKEYVSNIGATRLKVTS